MTSTVTPPALHFLDLQRDLCMICVEALPYPEGISEAFDKLYRLNDSLSQRTIYGLSYMENGIIHYLAAVEELYSGEASQYQCRTTILKAGRYAYVKIKNYNQDVGAIPRAFAALSAQTGKSEGNPDIECYHSDQEMICLRKQNQTKKNKQA